MATRTGLAAAVGPIVLGLLFLQSSIAQSHTPSIERPSFDVASIKPSGPFVKDFKLVFGPNSHMILSNVSLRFLIKFAYELRDDDISGGPDWIGSKLFDIEAKCDPPFGGDPRKMTYEARKSYETQMKLRLQSLLADRFQVRIRQQMKQMAVFESVATKKGPKLQESPALSPDRTIKQGAIVAPGHIEAYRASMDTIARILTDSVGRTVLDRTGLKGAYDVKLDWSPEPDLPVGPVSDARPSEDPSGPTLFTALREQLGLALRPGRSLQPYFVVEKATLPDAN